MQVSCRRRLWLLLSLTFYCRFVVAIVGGRQAAEPPPDDPVVFIKSGENAAARIEGKRSATTGIYAFRGIHYAEPPTGKNRFARPQFLRPTGDINATQNGVPCPQPDPTNPHRQVGSEDCLILNVFTPKMPDSPDWQEVGLPVIFFIHPGGYRYGSIAQYGAEPLVSQDVIFVPAQYRLGTLGLVDSQGYSTNLAMFDLTVALRWVTEYIRFFGGNPKKITAMGHGSGAAASNLLAISPQSRSGLSGVISMSGNALSASTYDTTPRQSMEEISKANDCDNDVISCLKNKALNEIVLNDGRVQENRVARNMAAAMSGMAGFSPVIEPKYDSRGLPSFLSDSPPDILQAGTFKAIPMLAGTVKDETASFFNTNLTKNVVADPQKFIKNFQNLASLKGFFEQFVKPKELFEKIVEGSTDALFNLPMVQTLSEWSKVAPAFLYHFEYKGTNLKGKKFLGGLPISVNQTSDFVSHGDELMYLFHGYDIFGNEVENQVHNSAR